MRLFCLFVALFLASAALQAQDYERRDIDLDLFIQELFQAQDDDVNYEDLYESLFQYYRNPLNLNTANKEELSSLYVLSETQVNAFFAYRNTYGKLLSIYELQAVPTLDLQTIYKLLPFVTVQDFGINADRRSLFNRIAGEDNNALYLRYERTLQERRGFSARGEGRDTTRYLGSPDKFYARYRVSHIRDFSLGFTAEKDAGEQFVWDPATRRYGIDFFSAHFQVYNKGVFKTIALGDYQLQMGQGLVLASGFGAGKGSETINTLRRSHLGIRPYTSVLEANFFRGAATTLQLGKFDVTGFFSSRRVDANLNFVLDSLGANSEVFFGAERITGFHRTINEIANKGTLRKNDYGGNIAYTSHSQNLKLGVTALNTVYNVPLQRTQRDYNQFDFNGKSNLILGAHYSYNWRNFNFFGETARSQSGGIGTVNGFMASLSPKVDFGMVYRNFDRNFHSLYGNGFSEGSRNINERGLYYGIKIRPFSKWEINGYYDRFSFPWLRYQVDAPSGGYEYLGRITFRPSRQVVLYSQYRVENKGKNYPGNTTNIDYVEQAERVNYLFNIDYNSGQILSLRSRVQFNTYQLGKESSGYMVWQDVNFDFGRTRVSTRYSIFDTDNWDTRQYAFEKDVLYAFSIPAFYGRGTRVYVLLQQKFTRKIDFWIKYAVTQYRDRNEIGTGLEAISGNTASTIRAQIRYKF